MNINCAHTADSLEDAAASADQYLIAAKLPNKGDVVNVTVHGRCPDCGVVVKAKAPLLRDFARHALEANGINWRTV